MWRDKIKKIFTRRKIKKFANGAISLFLVVTMLPFLSIAALLIETNRYNSCISVLDEMMGSASLSTLSDYDRYLLDRFGLLSFDQQKNLELTYKNYIEQNAGIMGSSLHINSIKANGEYPLSESEMLLHQIMEYSSLNAPTKIGTEALNIDELVKKIESFANLGDIFSVITSGSDVLNKSKDLYDNFGDFKTKADSFSSLESTYNEKYTAFDNAVKALAEALKEPRPEAEEEPEPEPTPEAEEEEEKTPEEIEEEKKKEEEEKEKKEKELRDAQSAYDTNINNLKAKVRTTKQEYLDASQSIINELESYKQLIKDNEEALSGITGAVTGFAGDIADLRNDISEKKKTLNQANKDLAALREEFGPNDAGYKAGLDYKIALENEIAELETKEGIYNASMDAANGVAQGYEDTLGSYTVDNVQSYINRFQTQINNINSNYSTSSTFFMNSSNCWNYTSGLNGGYHTAVGGYIPKDKVNEYFETQKDEFIDGSFSAFLSGIQSFYESIFKMKGIYDPELAANIDVNYYNDVVGGLPGGDAADSWVMRIVQRIGDVIDATNNLKDEIVDADNLWESIKEWVNPFQKIIDIINRIIELVDSIIELVNELVRVVTSIVNNIIELFTSPDRLFLCTYSVYNMPCRTDNSGGVASFKAMNGKSFGGDTYFQRGASTGLSTFDGLLGLIDTVKSVISGSGSDLTFRACDMEYILFGSNSEIGNQMFVFLGMYMLRLMLDAAPVITNAEVQSLAAASTLGYPIVIALIVFLEPLADALILVNGGEVALIKTKVYLTPTGAVELAGKFTSLGLQADDCKNALASAFGAAEDDLKYQQTLNKKAIADASSLELIPLDYRGHCLLLMLICPTMEQQLARIQNIVQMEGLYYYKTNKGFEPFKLSNAFTFIGSEVEAKVNNFMPVPALSTDTLFTATRKQLRGY